MIGNVDFSKFTDSNGKNEMYEAFEEALEERDLVKDYVIFDKDEKIVWICWYGKEPI